MDKTSELEHGALSPERTAFITKVYGLLGLSLLAGGVGALVGGQVSVAYYFPLRILGLVTLIAALVCRKMRGLNLALLFGFTFLNGVAAGTFLLPAMANSAHVTSLVMQSMVLAGGTFGGLTAYVFWSRRDFSYLKGFLWTGLISLILVALVHVFFGLPSYMYTLYLYVSLLVFIGFTLYDTSNLIAVYDTDDYVAATLNLYWDIVQLFWTILRIFLNRED